MLNYCAIGKAERAKCEDWSRDVSRNNYFQFDVGCVQASDKDECMKLIEDRKVDFVLLDPGEVYIAGRHHSLVPIVYEQYGPSNQTGYYSVAIVKASSSDFIRSLKDLRSKQACFSGVGHLAGWVLPMAKLLELDLIDIMDCNNVIQNAANFFAESCAPNALIDKNNPIGTNSQQMCSLCASHRCVGNDLYSNFDGALLCLRDKGDIAFVKHTTLNQMAELGKLRKSDYELLCPNGERAPVDGFMNCNWGFVPPHAIVISSVILPKERKQIQDFLIQSSRIPASSLNVNYLKNNDAQFNLFKSTKYGSLNLIFSEDTTSLVPISEYRHTYRGYFSLFNSNIDIEQFFGRLRKCDVPSAKLCVVSLEELKKCNNMKTAFRTQVLKPELSCVKGESTRDCMQKINQGNADLAVLDAADIHTGGQKYNLEPIVSELNNLNDSYYVVAIAKKADKTTDLLYLKGKRSCHSGYKTAAGWVVPLAFLLTNSRMRSYGCDSIRAASEFFSQACVPGVLSQEFNSHESVWEYNNLCNLCHGNSYRFCRRDSSEPYFGDTGALRCLVEGGGNVAFAKHTTIFENTNGRNMDFWARNKIEDDFELLCKDGSRDEVTNFAKCHLAQVSTNAIVTSQHKPHYYKEAYVKLFIYAQHFFGSKYSKDFTFKMFVSDGKFKDLIFQDSTVKLNSIPYDKRNFRDYLGHDFIKSVSITDCNAAAASSKSWVGTILMLVACAYCLM